MLQELLDIFGVDVACKEQCSTGVPKIMETYHRQSSPLQKRGEGSLAQVRGREEVSGLGGEYEPVVLAQLAEPQSLFALFLAVTPEGFNRTGCVLYGAFALLSLWLTQQQPSSALRERSPDAYAAAFEIHIRPLESQEFSLVHPGVYREQVQSLEPVASRGLQ